MESWNGARAVLRGAERALEADGGLLGKDSAALLAAADGSRDADAAEFVDGFVGASLGADRRCVDCDTLGADWASISHGTLLCTDCAGRHRGLGVHLSFVRSTAMDKWSHTHLRRMELGGNEGEPRLPVSSGGLFTRLPPKLNY